MKKILITGASGFIGSFLVEEALKRDYAVHAGIRSSSSRKYLKDANIKFVELNLAIEDALIKQLAEIKNTDGGFDYVIHNAGITKAKNATEFLTVNFHYTQHLVN